MSQLALLPPLPAQAKDIFNNNKRSFQKKVQKWRRDHNTKVGDGPRNKKIESTYCDTIHRLIELLAWQYKDGKVRADGYFYTTIHGIKSFDKESLEERSIRRHIQHLQKLEIIKDVDKKTPGPEGPRSWRHGFWIRLADWIVEGLLTEVTEALYEKKKEILEQDKQQQEAANQSKQARAESVEARMDQAIRNTTDRVKRHIEQRGNVNGTGSLLDYYIAKNRKNGPNEKPAPS